MLARQLAYITYVRGSMSTLQIHLFLCFYEFMPPTLSREEPVFLMILLSPGGSAFCDNKNSLQYKRIDIFILERKSKTVNLNLE